MRELNMMDSLNTQIERHVVDEIKLLHQNKELFYLKVPLQTNNNSNKEILSKLISKGVEVYTGNNKVIHEGDNFYFNTTASQLLDEEDSYLHTIPNKQSLDAVIKSEAVTGGDYESNKFFCTDLIFKNYNFNSSKKMKKAVKLGYKYYSKILEAQNNKSKDKTKNAFEKLERIKKNIKDLLGLSEKSIFLTLKLNRVEPIMNELGLEYRDAYKILKIGREYHKLTTSKELKFKLKPFCSPPHSYSDTEGILIDIPENSYKYDIK